MKRLILAAISLTITATPLLAQTNTGSFQDQYGVLTERNMFMRDRPRPRPPRDTRSSNRPDTISPEYVERSIVLRGVAIEDNELHAYLENSRTGQRFRIAPGDKLASGNVDEIAIDAIAYEANGRTVWIEIGQNLTGAKAEASSSSRYNRDSSSGGYRGSNSGSSSGGNTTNNANPNEGANGGPPDQAAEGRPPEETPSPSASSLEERMKQRRLQQRGGGK